MALCKLLRACEGACRVLSPIVAGLYGRQSLVGEKKDKSHFTVADGLVQELLTGYLLPPAGLAAVVGEEDSAEVEIRTPPYRVAQFAVPEDMQGAVDAAKEAMQALGRELGEKCEAGPYQELTAFIDPIDGTREFATGKGEQCSICIGFARAGSPVAGVVWRPLSDPPTWASGAAEEKYVAGELSCGAGEASPGLLTTNGAITPFLEQLMQQLRIPRVPSGGCGNKVLLLLEGKGTYYIQDRGVSRWDTCAAQAILEARGGCLLKLSPFVRDGAQQGYTYRRSEQNCDFVPNEASLTPYNAADAGALRKGERVLAAAPGQVLPYANLQGLLAVHPSINSEGALQQLREALQRAAAQSAPDYN
eukprot:TRINITY_DN17938_c0_g2_i1.p1 TRINITY_DN17938_c0_g2~~TRINITY_DN17938_c0_g2_i1.p1  ORF type:complete len:390 (+),score=154.99 TRINITY_DN17938_c0_g2_i1:87-1172(+)